MKRSRDHLLLASEVSLALVALAAIVGMHRVFEDGSYRGPLAVQAIVASIVIAGLRRAGVRLLPAAGLTALAAVLFITWTHFAATTQWLLPTPDTVSQAGDDLGAAWRLFGEVRAPAPVENGFLAATAAALWLLVFVADWAAFRAAATFEALLPATTLFVFAAALGGSGSPVASAAVFAGAALLYVLLHRTANQERNSRWAGGRRAQGRTSLVGTGTMILGVAVIAGIVAGPNMPGAGDDAVIAWRDINRTEPTRVVPSPMVSLQTTLVDQSNVELFTVRSEKPSYWRLTALNEFDGEIWRSSYGTDSADGTLPRALDPETKGDLVTQEITIRALGGVWLPAAYEPLEFHGAEDQPTVYDDRSSTLMVERGTATSDGYSYTVTSMYPDFDADTLRGTSTDIPDDIRETYLQLPDDFPDLAETEAYQLTRDAPTPWDKALAIQNHLKTFDYSLQVPPGHDEDSLLRFLFETRTGYCEQFAGAFAALARSVGLPSRVVIGFTPGVQDPNDPTLYRVRGIHMHAWVEVYMGEYGWVLVDPTPDRGPPGAESWLGIAPGQDTSAGGVAAGAEPLEGAGDGLGSSGTPAGMDGAGLDPDAGLDAGAVPAPRAEASDEESWAAEPARHVGRPVGVGALLYLLVVPVAIVAQRAVRRRRAATPAARAQNRWAESTTSAIRAGVALPPSLTIAEQADRMAHALPGAAPAIQQLARTMEAIAYAEVPPSADAVDDAEASWASIVSEANRRQGWLRRVLTYLDVRMLFTHRGTRRVAQEGPTVSPVA